MNFSEEGSHRSRGLRLQKKERTQKTSLPEKKLNFVISLQGKGNDRRKTRQAEDRKRSSVAAEKTNDLMYDKKKKGEQSIKLGP